MDALTAFLLGAVGGFVVALFVVTPTGREVTRVVAKSTGQRLAREIKG